MKLLHFLLCIWYASYTLKLHFRNRFHYCIIKRSSGMLKQTPEDQVLFGCVGQQNNQFKQVSNLHIHDVELFDWLVLDVVLFYWLVLNWCCWLNISRNAIARSFSLWEVESDSIRTRQEARASTVVGPASLPILSLLPSSSCPPFFSSFSDTSLAS